MAAYATITAISEDGGSPKSPHTTVSIALGNSWFADRHSFGRLAINVPATAPPALVGVLKVATTPTPATPPPTAAPTEAPIVAAPPEAPVEREPAAVPAPLPPPVPEPVPPPPPPAGGFRYDIESALAPAFNDARAQNGLGGVSVNGSLAAAAESYVEYHYLNYGPYALSHSYDGSPSERAARQGYGCCAIGEVIAYGAGSAQGFVDLWMNSSGHRGIILDGRYADVGIGCYQSGSEPVLCVAIFGSTSW